MKKLDKEKSSLSLSPRYGLRVRLILLVFIALVPAFILILHNAKRDRDVSAERIQEDAQRIVEIAAARQARFIDSALQLLAVLAEVPEVANGDAATCNRFVEGLTNRYSVYGNLGRIDAEGNLVCSAIGFSGTRNLADRSYFRRAKGSKSFAIGDYQVGRVTERGSVNFGYPILNRAREVSAIVFAALDLGWLTQLTGEARLPEGASLSILDSQGTILARFPDPEKWSGKPVPDAPLFQILQLRDQAIKELVGVDGVKRLYAFTTLSGKPQTGQMYVVVGIPKEIAFAEVDQRLQRNLGWLGVACLLALATAWFIGNRQVVAYVTAHARAEEARFQLASIVESSEDAIVGKSLDGNITSWNDGAEVMYGYTEEEVKGQPITILNPPDRPNEIPQLLEIVRQGKGINRYETERIRKDGRRLYVSASVSPIRDYEGKSSVLRLSVAISLRSAKLRRSFVLMRVRWKRSTPLDKKWAELSLSMRSSKLLWIELFRHPALTLHSYIFQANHPLPRFMPPEGALRSSTEPMQLLAHLGDDFERKITTCMEPWFVEDAAALPGLEELQAVKGMRAWVVLPLSGGEQRRGTLTLMSPSVQTFGPEESQFLQALGQQIALAIENAQLYGATVEVNAHLQEEIEERNRAEKTLADFTAMVVHDLRSPALECGVDCGVAPGWFVWAGQ